MESNVSNWLMWVCNSLCWTRRASFCGMLVKGPQHCSWPCSLWAQFLLLAMVLELVMLNFPLWWKVVWQGVGLFCRRLSLWSQLVFWLWPELYEFWQWLLCEGAACKLMGFSLLNTVSFISLLLWSSWRVFLHTLSNLAVGSFFGGIV